MLVVGSRNRHNGVASRVQLKWDLVGIMTMRFSLTPRFIEVLAGGRDSKCFNSFGVSLDKPLKRFCVSSSPRHPTNLGVNKKRICPRPILLRLIFQPGRAPGTFAPFSARNGG